MKNSYQCYDIHLEPQLVPQKSSILTLFGSQLETANRISNSLWPIDAKAQDRYIVRYTTERENILVLSQNERFANAIVLSGVHRVLTLLVSDVKLKYIDKITNRTLRTALNLSASAILPAVLYYVGCPLDEVILSSFSIQAAARACNYLSFGAGNFLRQLDLISETKVFNQFNYAKRILGNFAAEGLASLLLRGKDVLASLHSSSFDTYHTIKFCFPEVQPIASKQKFMIFHVIDKVAPIFNLSDKLVWQAGRIMVDVALMFAHSQGLVADIRSPILNAFHKAKSSVSRIIQGRTKTEQKQAQAAKPTRKAVQHHEDPAFAVSEEKYPAASLSSFDIAETTPVKEKTKTRKPNAQPMPGAPAAAPSVVTEVHYGDYEFYRLTGRGGIVLGDNCWGVINPQKVSLENLDGFVQALQSKEVGGMHNQWLRRDCYHLRTSDDPRLVGYRYRGISGLNRLFAESFEAMKALEEFSTHGNSEFSLIIYDTEVAKHEDLSKSIHVR